MSRVRMADRESTLKRQFAHLIKNTPLLTGLMRLTLKWSQARFTAGVVGVILNEENKVLVVEHVFHPDHPWGLPGGWLKAKEPPAEALAREIAEETGVRVRIIAPLHVDTGYYYKDHLDIAFLCQAECDVQALSGELMDFRWVGFDALPSMLPFHEAAVATMRSLEVLRP